MLVVGDFVIGDERAASWSASGTSGGGAPARSKGVPLSQMPVPGRRWVVKEVPSSHQRAEHESA